MHDSLSRPANCGSGPTRLSDSCDGLSGAYFHGEMAVCLGARAGEGVGPTWALSTCPLTITWMKFFSSRTNDMVPSVPARMSLCARIEGQLQVLMIMTFAHQGMLRIGDL